MKKLLISFLSAITLIFTVGAISACKQKYQDYYFLSYYVSEGGSVQRQGFSVQKVDYQRIKRNGDGEAITAIADTGYYFVKWSDGITESTRKDINITSNIKVTAEFAEITDGVTIKYTTRGVGKSGYITGMAEQVVQRGTDGWAVTASIVGGQENDILFVGWSDGVTTETRQERCVTEDMEITAQFGFIVNYSFGEHGSVEGNLNQVVGYAEYASSVIAVPEKGYTFIGWSDGVMTAERQDFVASKIIVTAYFEWRDTDYFTYNYDYPTGNYGDVSLKLTRGQVNENKAIIPTRDHFTFGGWYYDRQFKNRATDVNGNILDGEGIFDQPSRDLYAKWSVIEEDVVTYKILMVYVTAIDGEFLGNDGMTVDVHYRMSAEERKVCERITEAFDKKINDLLDGLIKFEIDTYFTTQSINQDSFVNEVKNVHTYAYMIEELANSDLMDDYRSVITTFSFGGNENLHTYYAGVADVKYASIPIDVNLKCSLDRIREDHFNQYNYFVSTYVHEFIHTIEQAIVCYSYHNAYCSYLFNEPIDKLYLLNQYPAGFYHAYDKSKLRDAWVNSEKFGIPYSMWKNEVFEVTILVQTLSSSGNVGGWVGMYDEDYEWDYVRWNIKTGISSGRLQRVPKGSRTTQLLAKTFPGFKFVGWSDGCKDRFRIIRDVQQDMTLIAYFEEIQVSTDADVKEGGSRLMDFINLSAISEDGYEFMDWVEDRFYIEKRFKI